MTTTYCTSSRKPSETPTGGTCSRTSASHSTLSGEQLFLLSRSVCVVMTAVVASATRDRLSTAVGLDRHRSLLLELFPSVLCVISSITVYLFSFSLHKSSSMYLFVYLMSMYSGKYCNYILIYHRLLLFLPINEGRHDLAANDPEYRFSGGRPKN